jgi:transcriptional regulator of acetoin/glycerol metabolism
MSLKAEPGAPNPVEPEQPSQAPLELDLERLLAALRATGGNVTRAAARLGVTRQRAYRLLEEQSVDLATLAGPRRTKR